MRRVILLLAALLVSPVAAAAGPGLSVVTGAAYDRETGESMPARLIAGLDLTWGPVELLATADCGLPWEPSARADFDADVLDADWVRWGLGAMGSWRSYAGYADESRLRFSTRAEIGPRIVSLSGGVGVDFLSTYYPSIGAALTDRSYCARIGVLARPVDRAEVELAIAADAALSLWLRTSFELRGWWEPWPGHRFSGLLALRYSDFFTLTSYVDGFEARLLYTFRLLEES